MIVLATKAHTKALIITRHEFSKKNDR